MKSWLWRGIPFWPSGESIWVVTFLGLLIFWRQLVVAAVIQVSFTPQTRHPQRGFGAECQAWCCGRHPAARVPHGQRAHGSAPWLALRISEPLLLLPGPFLSKLPGDWLWRVNFRAVSRQPLICTSLCCSVQLFHPLPSAQGRS